MQKWEYKEVSALVRIKIDALNALGAEGWELVAVVNDGMGVTAYLKRRVT